MKYSFNFCITHNLTQIVDFPTRIPDCNTHRPALLDLFLTSDPGLCSVRAFAPLGNSDVVVSVSVDFTPCPEKVAHYQHKAFEDSRTDWDGFHDHFKDAPWNNIYKYGASRATSGFLE